MSTETDSITTLSAHLDHVDSLNAQAKELMPFKVDECSYEQGYVRQKVWSCRTCSREGDGEVGVCYACSVSCHAGTFSVPCELNVMLIRSRTRPR